ncbi:MAG: heavy metal sensor histidine kinase, partial [Gammaproteobacteria bacterium]
EYRRGLLIFLLLLIPVLVVAGRLVTQRGLRPLERITRAAKAVTPTHLADRIPLDPPWPPELADLVRVFNDMMQRLDEAFARLARFSADLAHELRTPLNNLMGEVEVCLARERGADEYRQTLESGLEECRRLAALIENLLFIARAENTEKSIYIESFDTYDACVQVLELHMATATKHGVSLVCEGNAWLKADRLLFRQALGNLLANAIRYSPPGSQVRVVTRTLVAGGVEIEVLDQGPGIPSEYQPHVFDRFYQADPARARQGQGTGLGLAIVRSIMELHAGEASLDSRPGRGTVARLRFPGNVSDAKMTKLSSA